jgi:regulator of protease activity HflC (stomatin/prohibitin superfamily)
VTTQTTEHHDRVIQSFSGLPALLLWFLLFCSTIFMVPRAPFIAVPVLIALMISLFGFFINQPNQAKVLQLFGAYVGTVKDSGLRWANPFYTKRTVSLRVRNFESQKLKVNELDGSPIEIGAIVVWQVTNAAQASFQVDDYESFVHIQTESALRALATSYPYDQHDGNQIALRSHTHEVAEQLQKEVQGKLSLAGVEILDTRISHLAYAPEIAQAMLQRQQAGAVLAARQRIVEGAVGMVEMALGQLSARGVVELDSERKAAMVSNLLVVLCSERNAQPVINAGSIY